KSAEVSGGIKIRIRDVDSPVVGWVERHPVLIEEVRQRVFADCRHRITPGGPDCGRPGHSDGCKRPERIGCFEESAKDRRCWATHNLPRDRPPIGSQGSCQGSQTQRPEKTPWSLE